MDFKIPSRKLSFFYDVGEMVHNKSFVVCMCMFAPQLSERVKMDGWMLLTFSFDRFSRPDTIIMRVLEIHCEAI